MELSFSKLRLRFYFFVGALICQLIASNIPAFDTSHLVSKPSSNSPDSTPLEFSRASLPTDHSFDLNKYRHNLVPSAGLRWDALHYIDVALSGAYTYEHQYAFSPGVPIVVRLVYFVKEQTYHLASQVLLPGSNHTEFCYILANLINALFVVMVASQPSLALYNLTERITRSKEFSFLTLLVHVILGAPPVIIRSVYAEPFFAWFTFEGLSACHQQKYLTASLYFALATVFRTNGILLPCFLVYSLIFQHAVSGILLNLRKPPGTRRTSLPKSLYQDLSKLNLSFTRLIYCTFLVMVSLSPFVAQQYMAYISFCQSSNPRPWCNSPIPLIYSFVQSHYWDVGPWRYWTIAQIPNFLLALPILSLAFSSLIWFFLAVGHPIQTKHERVDPLSNLALTPSMALILLPYAIHALVLSLTLFIAAHVQISLRVLPAATPWISWAGAALIIQGTRYETGVAKKNGQPGVNSRNGSWWPFLSSLWLGWSVIWVFISSVLWLAFLPPA